MAINPVVLYVEDDPMSREVMKLLLVRGMDIKDVFVFNDSHDFMNRLRDLPHVPNLILLDIHMEPYTGFELLDMLRRDERYRNITTVALTASVMNEEVHQLRQAGFDGVLAKPIDQMAFPKIFKRILDGDCIWNV